MLSLFKNLIHQNLNNVKADISKSPRKPINTHQAIYNYGVSAAGHKTIFSKPLIERDEHESFNYQSCIDKIVTNSKFLNRGYTREFLSLFFVRSKTVQQTIKVDQVTAIYTLNFGRHPKELEDFPTLYDMGKYFKDNWLKAQCKSWITIKNTQSITQEEAKDTYGKLSESYEKDFDGCFNLEYYADNLRFQNSGVAHRFTLLHYLNTHFGLNKTITVPFHTVKINQSFFEYFDARYEAFLIALPTSDDVNNFNELINYTESTITQLEVETPNYENHSNQYIYIIPRKNNKLSDIARKWIKSNHESKEIISIADLMRTLLISEQKNIKKHEWVTAK